MHLPIENKNSSGSIFRSWQWWIFSLVMVFNLYQILHHAMWRDEIHFWSLGLASPSLSALIHNGRFDGHPALWSTCLWLLTHISESPVTMQLFHFVCALSASLVIIMRAPFLLTTRLLIVTGYYFSFEYLVISRAYVLGVLITVCYCAAYDILRERPLLSGLVLGLLANTSVYGAILALVFLVGPGISYATIPEERSRSKIELKNIGMQSVAFIPFLVISILVMTPAAGGSFAVGWYWGIDLRQLLDRFCKLLASVIPIPEFTPHFWNTFLVYGENRLLLSFVIALMLLLAICWMLRESRLALIHFLLVLTGMLLFQYTKYPGGARHNGTLFITIIAVLWLMDDSWRPKDQTIDSPSKAPIFAIIMGLNIFAYIIASWYHLHYPFSCGKAMAEYIQQQKLINRPLIGHPEYRITTVAGYLQKPIMMLGPKEVRTHVIWEYKGRDEEPTLDELISYARGISISSGAPPLILLPFYHDIPQLGLLSSETGSITGEDFYLYEYK